MDAILLTWRWQNILSIWIMIIALFLVVTMGAQIKMKLEGESAANGA